MKRYFAGVLVFTAMITVAGARADTTQPATTQPAVTPAAYVPADNWTEPPDKQFPDAELTAFLPTLSDWADAYSEILRDAARAHTDAERFSVLQEIDQKQKSVLAKHHMSEAEFNWMQERATEAWTVMTIADKVLKGSQSELKQQSQDNAAKLADARKRLAIYQAALKAGTQVLSPEDREAAIKAARDDEQTAQDEVKQHVDDAAAAEAEAKQHDAEAKAADDLANNPPSDVTADDRQSFIDGKKAEAASDRDAAKDARSREADANKAHVEAQAKADAAAARLAHPEVPVTDDDKAAAKADDLAGITAAQTDIDTAAKNAAAIETAENKIQSMQSQIYKDVPPENIALMRKHYAEYKKIADKQIAAATMPSR
jgi:hypothetical protein